ncbi:diphthine synthase [Candidatus Bathyarchaeota archaeon]|nr:MAG: diphthine synthase [Candidatus Bathyarchaeota archaeon]
MTLLKELVFIGLGLYDERDVSLRGLEEMKSADYIFIETYTSLMPNLSIERLERLCGKKLEIVSRHELEEKNGEKILKAATKGKAVLLVPGDPLIATTHIALRIQAERMGIKTRIVHGASIISAAIGLSGLHNYKFGKSVTIPFPERDYLSETPYHVIWQNKQLGLHTLCLLDVKAEKKMFMTIKQAIEVLQRLEKRIGKELISDMTLAVGIARAGSENCVVKAGTLKELKDYDFGGPPHTLIFPGKLHFMEAEALKVLGGASEKIEGIN